MRALVAIGGALFVPAVGGVWYGIYRYLISCGYREGDAVGGSGFLLIAIGLMYIASQFALFLYDDHRSRR